MSEVSDAVRSWFFPVNYIEDLLDSYGLYRQSIYKLKTPTNEQIDELRARYGLYACTCKLKQWSYEDEWRYFYIPKPGNTPANYSTDGILISSFPKPSKIILGIDCAQIDREALVNVATDEGVEVAEMRATPFGLKEQTLRVAANR